MIDLHPKYVPAKGRTRVWWSSIRLQGRHLRVTSTILDAAQRVHFGSQNEISVASYL